MTTYSFIGWLGPKPLGQECIEVVGIRKVRKAAEATNIAKSQLGAVIQLGEKMRVRLDSAFRRSDRQLAGHSEVNQ